MQIVFVQIVKCICPNGKLYFRVLVLCELSELGELRFEDKAGASETIHKGFLNPLWEMQTFVSPLCTEQIPEEGDGLTEFLFPKQTNLKKANGDLNMTNYYGWFSCKMQERRTSPDGERLSTRLPGRAWILGALCLAHRSDYPALLCIELPSSIKVRVLHSLWSIFWTFLEISLFTQFLSYGHVYICSHTMTFHPSFECLPMHCGASPLQIWN